MRLKCSWVLAVTALVLTTAASVAAQGDLRLIEAAKRQDGQTARALLKQGIDVNATQGDGASALHWAVYRDDQALADLLLRAGADVNTANDLGATPLSLACANANGAMVKRLLAAGANPNTPVTPSGETPLITAAGSGSVDAVKALLAQGATVNAAETAHGQTALMWAAANGHPGVVQALVEGGADVNARSRIDRMVVALMGQGEYPSGVEIDGGGGTPLFFAARSGDLASARALIAAGADVHATTPTKTSVLVFAAHSGHGEVAAYLLEKGADPNADGSGYTALHAAVLRGDLALVKALLASGADPNARLKQGTPTRRASQDYNLSVLLSGLAVLAGREVLGNRDHAHPRRRRSRPAAHAAGRDDAADGGDQFRPERARTKRSAGAPAPAGRVFDGRPQRPGRTRGARGGQGRDRV